jgi:VCBS repeat-containing protein
MASDPLAPVSAGDDVTSTAFSAAGINAVRDAARKVRERWPRPEVKPGGGAPPCLEVIVRNDTGDDLDAFSVVVIQTDTVVDPNSVPFEFQARPVYAVDIPEGGLDGYGTAVAPGRPLILSEPIPEDGFGRAVVSGHSLAYVQINDPDQEYARPVDGDVTRLMSAAGGPVRILWRSPAAGSRVLCGVYLGHEGVDGWTVGGVGPFVAQLTGTATGLNPLSQYFRVATFFEPGFYLCTLPFYARLVGDSNMSNSIVTFLSPNTYGGNLRVGWNKLPALGDIEFVCSAAAVAFQGLSATTYRRLNVPASGGGCLVKALNLDESNLPYELGLTWLAALEQIEQPVGGLKFTDVFALQLGIGSLGVVRVPGIRPGSNTGWGTLIAPTQPNPATGGGVSAADDSYTVPAGGTLSVAAPGVLANDTVPAGYGPVLDSDPQYGTLTFKPSGGFTYVQDVALTGLNPPLLDTFTYHLSDGTTSSQPATVTITITGGTTGHGGFAPVMSPPAGTSGVAGSVAGSTSGPSSGGGTV